MFGPGVKEWLEGFTPEVALALIAEVRRLRERLEIDKRHGYDGIYCRDETIRGLERKVAELRKDKERLDSGRIMLSGWDDFGDRYKIDSCGNNLRQMIDEAMAIAEKEAK
jgi:hypothetical protein